MSRSPLGSHSQGAAIRSLRRALGAGNVVVEPAALARAETATYSTDQRVLAIARPANREQVQACVRIANRYEVPIYPISRGKNWGYGSAVPVRDGSVIVDLGRMDRILDYSEELAYATVEPGVTQRQLFDFLRAKGSRLWLDTTSSSPEASLVGNVVERGHGLTPYADHAGLVSGLEVVLPEGSFIRTGFGRFPKTRLAALDPWGVGPSFDGLFSQSNLGIVTQMTVWLMPAPEYMMAGFIQLASEGDLVAALDAARPLRLDGTIRAGPQFWNEYRSIQRSLAFPWRRTGGRTPLGSALAATIASELGIGAWNGVVGLYGSRPQVRDQRARVVKALSGIVDRMTFVDAAQLARAKDSPRVRGMRRMVAFLTGGRESMGMGPARAYWRKPGGPPGGDHDLDRDRCGFLWCTAMTPFVGREALRAARLARTIILRRGFEPDVSMVPIRDRALHMHISIVYDRDAPGHDARALACSREVGQALAERGYLPHRLGLHSMGLTEAGDSAYGDAMKRIRAALDPKGIMAPGRYGA